LPNVGPYIYTTLAFLALLGAPYIYDISSLRVKVKDHLNSPFFFLSLKYFLNFYFSSICSSYVSK